jgi:anti-sigma regulatory factor (Ser/Thr protein kinase)
VIREIVEKYLLDKGLKGDTLGLYLTGLGEAVTNAIKHAAGGEVFAGCNDGRVWTGVWDTGSGIPALTLPKATLRRGYSTKISMGMGYAIMLEVTDKTMLSTGPEGSIVVLFKNISQTTPAISLDDLPDTW